MEIKAVIHLLGWLVTLSLLSSSGQNLIDQVLLLSIINNPILIDLLIEYLDMSSTLLLKLVRIRCRIEFLHKDDDDEVTKTAWCQSRNFLCLFIRVSSNCEHFNILFLKLRFLFTDFASLVYVYDNFNAN
jgi:hypothetical protein